jgi:signal transduction histidine kinase
MPLQSSLVLLCSFLFCVFLFGTYDFLRQREFDRNQAVLDTKRRFVRFISHEIRTPLNTVRLGMKLLEVEIGKLAKSIAVGSPADLITLVEAALLSYQHLADEIIESSESAVEVLNDLLNYDKIEVGTLKLDVCYFNVRDLVQKTVSAMQVQAQQKGITLDFSSCAHCADGLGDSLPPDLEAGDVEGWRSWTIIGDNARIGQVLRNLISNALKFTPADREVSISCNRLSLYL